MTQDSRATAATATGSSTEAPSVARLRVQVFADGASLDEIARLAEQPLIAGFTTNPTLMRKAGVQDYQTFARQALAIVPDRPISFEVIADEQAEMERQAREIASWGDNVFVKIPITNTRGESTLALMERLSTAGVQVNATALTTLGQVEGAARALCDSKGAIVSVFAGRIADTGRDPVPLMTEAKRMLAAAPMARLLWASPREVLNIVQADQAGCDIITATSDLLAKLPLIGKDLDEFSLETVEMFYRDAVASGFTL